ncbi:MAG TPA: tetratricopeptide repeat protein [Spirochaetota bacterium]|nr:tetratricopeptide repeat protein [Spirochaetota bacterium]
MSGLVINIFLSVLLFGGISIILFIVLKKLMSPNKIGQLRTLIKGSNYKLAIKVAKDIIAKDSNNLEAHYYLGECYYNEGKYELALMEYKASDKVGAHNLHHINEFDLRLRLGELYIKFDNIEEALKEYLLLQKNYPDDSVLNFKIGELFEKKSMRDQAITHYQKSLSNNPNYVPALINNGVLLYEVKKYGDAAKNLEQSIKLEPSNYKAHFYLGLLKKAENNQKGAIKHFDISVRDKDYKVRSLMEKGTILMSMNKFDEAVIELERAAKNIEDPKSALTLNTRYLLAACYEQMRNITEAISQWEKIYSVKPDFKNVGEKLANYQDLRMDDKMKDFMTATNDEFLDICKKIVLNMGANITDMNILSNEGIEFFTLEGSEKFRNVKKKPKMFYIFRKSSPIEESTLRKVHETMRSKEIIKAVVITSSDFTKQALAFVQERPIELVDKNGLQNILKDINF